MAYPDNVFEQDQLEPDQYGGRPDGANTFDAKAWTWLTGLVRSISKVVLNNVRVSWSNGVFVVQNAVSIGDVLAMDMSRDFIDPTTQRFLPYVDKYSTILAGGGIPKIFSVAVTQAAALGKAQVALGGALPPSISGLTSQTGGGLVAADATTSRLRAWTNADEALGYTSPNGNVLLAFLGRVSV